MRLRNWPLAVSTWGDEEKQALLEVIESGQYTMGEKVSRFEQAYADWSGCKYAVMVNSGSSANLLMVAAMSLRQGTGTVIVPAIAWSTSYAPFQQYGWKLKVVDIDRDTLNYDIKALTEAYTGDELILAVNLLGNPNHYREFPSMDILEDNCEAMGAEYAGIRTGSFGIMASHSMFFSHHIQTMEGGIVTTDDEYFHQMLLCLRSHGWTRHLPKDNVLNAEVSAFKFIYPGYNVRPLEMMGAVGLKQLEKIDGFIAKRRENAGRWMGYCQDKGYWHQKEPFGGTSSWMNLAIVEENIDDIKGQLHEMNVEFRPIVGGNFMRSDMIDYFNVEVHGQLTNADYVHDHGIYIGNSHSDITGAFYAVA